MSLSTYPEGEEEEGCTCDEGHFEEGGRVEPCTCGNVDYEPTCGENPCICGSGCETKEDILV